MKRQAWMIIMPLLLISCNGTRLNYDKGIIPPVPVNFEHVNSIYDDYNSDLKISWTEMTFSLIFSTNRNLNGSNFDFIFYNGHIIFDLIEGDFKMETYAAQAGILEVINSNNNEFGPYFTSEYPYFHYLGKAAEDRRFFYTSDPGGNMDLFCCGYELGQDGFEPAGTPFALTALNTENNEGYLTMHSGATENRETAYFMSDRDGSFDIYRATGEEGKLITESYDINITRPSFLNSSADDKCPYICGNMMVFSSDRAGGFGGFDLWYSVYNGQEWSAPVNMGQMINTEYDEYRPVVVNTGDWYLNDLMIFSSNRPGGKGGFDLYYVGVQKRQAD